MPSHGRFADVVVDVSGPPTGDLGKLFGLVAQTFFGLRDVVFAAFTGHIPVVRVVHHVATLKVLAIGRLTKHQVFRHLVFRVLGVQPRDIDILRRRVAFRPSDAKLLEFFVAQRIRGTGVTPAHVPCIFHYDATAAPDGFVENIGVEPREDLFNEDRDVCIGGQCHGLIIGHVHAALLREHEKERVLI